MSPHRHDRHGRPGWVGRPAGPGLPATQLRIGDVERNDAISLLGEHFAEGRLTREEYDERCSGVFSARVGSDLSPLFADLPGRPPSALVPVPRMGPPPRARPRKRSPVPFLPVLLLLIGLAFLLGEGWVIPLGIGVWFLVRSAVDRWQSRTQAKGSRRPSGGNWS